MLILYELTNFRSSPNNVSKVAEEIVFQKQKEGCDFRKKYLIHYGLRRLDLTSYLL